MNGPEFLETTRLVLRRPIAADAQEDLRAVFKRSGSYQICWIAKASVHRRNQGVSSLQRSRMEPMARRPLLGRMSERSTIAWEYRSDFRIANRRRYGVRARSRCLGTRLRDRSVSRHRRCGAPNGGAPIACDLPCESSGVNPRAGEMRFCARRPLGRICRLSKPRFQAA